MVYILAGVVVHILAGVVYILAGVAEVVHVLAGRAHTLILASIGILVTLYDESSCTSLYLYLCYSTALIQCSLTIISIGNAVQWHLRIVKSRYLKVVRAIH